MLKERSQTFKIVFILLDLFTAIVSFTVAFFVRKYLQGDIFYYSWLSYLSLGLILSITQILAFISIELYHPRRGLSYIDEFIGITTGVTLNLLVILSLLFFFRGDSFSRLVILNYTISNILLTTISHYIFRKVLTKLRQKGYNLRSVLIIGTGRPAQQITEIFEKHTIYGYKVNGYIQLKDNMNTPEEFQGKVLGNIKDCQRVIQEVGIDIVIFALSYLDAEYLKDIIDICDTEGIDLKVVPDYTEFITAKGRFESIDGVPVISIRDIPIRLGYNQFIKRTFDITFSLFFVIFFSPFYLLIAIAIRLDSKGPIFLKQERVGLDNRKINMLKFRTMYVQEKTQSDTLWTVQNDPRVTRVGKFLRKVSLDETPQFFNSLMGSMSVVGPRPERPHFVEQFKTKHKNYMRRHAVKAGITGWAQVNGLRGDTSIDERIQADIFYIENWSLFFDIKIVLLTPLRSLFDRNAY